MRPLVILLLVVLLAPVLFLIASPILAIAWHAIEGMPVIVQAIIGILFALLVIQEVTKPTGKHKPQASQPTGPAPRSSALDRLTESGHRWGGK